MRIAIVPGKDGNKYIPYEKRDGEESAPFRPGKSGGRWGRGLAGLRWWGGPLPAPRCPRSGSFSPLQLELVAETQLSLEMWVRADTKRGQ